MFGIAISELKRKGIKSNGFSNMDEKINLGDVSIFIPNRRLFARRFKIISP